MATHGSELTTVEQRIKELVNRARNPNSKRAYDVDIAHYLAWCAKRSEVAVPADYRTLYCYFEALFNGSADRSPGSSPLRKGRWEMSTIQHRKASISKLHNLSGYKNNANPTKDPRILEILAAMRRTVGMAQVRKDPLLPDHLARAVDVLASDGLRGVRDRAILLLMFGGALRRVELTKLDYDQVTFHPEGVQLFLPFRKNDQEGYGTYLLVVNGSNPATCPATNLRAWIKASGIVEGALFRGIDVHGFVRSRLDPKEVARAVKRVAKRLGLDPTKYAGHSLRRGFVTAMRRADRSDATILRQTGHRDTRMLDVYTKDDLDWARAPGRGLL